MTIIDLDAPIYTTIYNLVTTTGTVIETYDDRETADKRAKQLGLRVLKTIKEDTNG